MKEYPTEHGSEEHSSKERSSLEHGSYDSKKDPSSADSPATPELSSSKLLRNIKGIILDFDGTLFDNLRIPFYMIAAHPADLFLMFKERLVRNSFAGCDYFSPDEYFNAFFRAMSRKSFRSPEGIRSWYFNRFMPRMIRVLKKHYMPRPGVLEVFRRLDPPPGSVPSKTRFIDTPKVAVYSDYPFPKERLEAIGIKPGPSVLLYGPESFGAQKPAARPFLQIARDFGVTPEEVLVIGDREDTDGLGAFKAGMRFFCLETGHKRYFRLDPYRRPVKEKPHGPSLLMYAGTWEDLTKLIKEKYFS